MGRMFWSPSESGLKKTLYMLFKPLKTSGGEVAATRGFDLEKKLADSIAERLKEHGIKVVTAGAGHGSDLTIIGKDPSQKMTIEIKTTLSADFGQFKIGLNQETGKWQPVPTAGF